MQALLLVLELGSEVINLGELVLHGVLHIINTFSYSFHLLVNPDFKVLDLVQISSSGLHFDLKLGGGHLSIIQLLLLEFEVVAHILDSVLAGEAVLSLKILLHVLEQLGNDLLVLADLLLVLVLLLLVLRGEFLNLLLLLSQDLKLGVVVVALVWLTGEFVGDFLQVALVLVDDLAHLADLLLLLLDFSVVLLDTVHQALTSLWEGQVHLVGLQFEVLLALQKVGFFVS